MAGSNVMKSGGATQAARAIAALILREMSTTYGRSPGGYLWAIIEPAAGVALLTAVFSIGFRAPPLGTSFPLFYAAGVLPFLMFNDLSGKLGQTIQFSRALLKYPRVTFLDAIIARLILNGFAQLMVNAIVLSFILWGLGARASIDAQSIAMAYLLVICLATGIGTLNAFLTLAYPLWATIWAIVTRPLFIISCVFFVFESVPAPYGDLLWFNPLVHIVGMMREGFYPFYHASYVSALYVMGLSAVTFITGLFLLWRYHRDILLK
nr:ABC transporter permease [Pseudohalocynthiibacter aestuariivivens]